MATHDVIIVGGGAAGLAAGIFAARRLPGLSITILDGAKRLGAKILVSGGGRCNVTNAVVRPGDYWGGSANVIKRVLRALPVEQTVAFFREIGVDLHEEPNGKLFPDSNSARTVLDALLREAERLNVRVLIEHRVEGIERQEANGHTPPEPPLGKGGKEDGRDDYPPGGGQNAHSPEGGRDDYPSEGGQDARPPAGFVIQTNQGVLLARKVVLATGGQSLPKTGSDGHGYQLAHRLGHSLVPTTPALAPLVLEGGFHAGLSGVSQDVELTIRAGLQGERPAGSRERPATQLEPDTRPAATENACEGRGQSGSCERPADSRERPATQLTPGTRPAATEGGMSAGGSGVKPVRLTGAMLWTHFGVSGPVAMNASRLWHRARLEGRPVQVTASFLPGERFESAEARLIAMASAQPRTLLHNALADLLPARVAVAILEHLGISTQIPLAHLGRDQRRRLVHALLEWPLEVRDSRGYNFAEATAGGVPLEEIDPGTMESRKCPGLFLVGEILDVDGRIGGFNFQWAWASAFVAGGGVTR